MAGIGISVGIARNSLGGVPAGASYLLDTYPAFAAYSTRQLAADATNCIICTEDGGGTEAIIGFSAGWLDEAAVASHCGASTGSVAQMYDQSGSGYNMANAVDSEQPEIYNGTSVYQQNATPAMFLATGSIKCLEGSSFLAQAQPYTVFAVNTNLDSGGRNYIYRSPSLIAMGFHQNGNVIAASPTALQTTAAIYAGIKLTTIMANGASSLIRQDAIEVKTGNMGTSAMETQMDIFGARAATDACDYGQEVIFMAGDQTANFAAIEADINAAFSVYA